MDPQEIQKLRDLPIEGVAERLGFDAERYARYFEHPWRPPYPVPSQKQIIHK